MDDLELLDVEPAVPEPDFFDAGTGGINNGVSISIPRPVLPPSDFNIDVVTPLPPENILEDLGTGQDNDDENGEFNVNEFLILGPPNIPLEGEERETKEEKMEDMEEDKSEDLGDEDQQQESSSAGSIDKKETAAPPRPKFVIRGRSTANSSGPDTPESRASAVVRLSLPKVQLDPTRRVSISKDPSPRRDADDEHPQQAKPSTTISPPRQSRGRLNAAPSSAEVPSPRGKRKMAESDDDVEDEDEELSVFNKSSTTRSGRQTRKNPRFGFEENGVSDKEGEKRNIKSPTKRKDARLGVGMGSSDKAKSPLKARKNLKVVPCEVPSDSGSESDYFDRLPTLKKGEYTIIRKLIHFKDAHGKTFIIKPSFVRATRLDSDGIQRLKDEVLREAARKRVLFEVCIDNFRSAQAAVEGGARRIELCTSLIEGGLTPSLGFLALVKKNYPDIPVFAMIRPRAGDFVYSSEEIEIMLKDIEQLKGIGADGFVFGVLTKDGEVDEDACQKLLYEAFPKECTFHRAFDRVPDPIVALENVIKAGFARILTSGRAKTAKEGVATLKRVVQAANNRIKIIAGAGINETNVAEIIKKTGVDEVHGSASVQIKQYVPSSKGKSRNGKRGSAPIISMGATDDTVIKITDSSKVAQIVKLAVR